MSRAQGIIIAALDRGPLFFERHAGCGWHMRVPGPRYKLAKYRPTKRYFRTMDVRRVIARGLAIQIENQLIKAV